jgi:hypothetical protein
MRPKDNSQRNCSAAWSGAPCDPGDDEDSGISESLFSLDSLFAYRGAQNGWELLSHPPYSLDLALSDHHLFRPLKDHLRDHHYETEEGVQEAVQSWLRGAGTDFYHTCIFKILQCIDQGGDFAEK